MNTGRKRTQNFQRVFRCYLGFALKALVVFHAASMADAGGEVARQSEVCLN